MKILFSPSEAKSDVSPIDANLCESLSFKELFSFRESVMQRYEKILKTAPLDQIKDMLGVKNENEIKKYTNVNLSSAPLQLAVLRYTGVGYSYLDFKTLEDEAKNIFLDSTIIFSNLFGPIKAGDYIPFYKLKQGKTLDGFKPSKFYNEHFSKAIDAELEGEFIVDLRAGFYEQFYKTKLPRVCVKFLKNGKNLSHSAKAYRGLMARALSIYNPKNHDEFKKMPIPDLYINEIIIKANTTTYIYDILA